MTQKEKAAEAANNENAAKINISVELQHNPEKKVIRDSFIYYRSFYEALQGLSFEEKGKCLDVLINYSLNGEEPDLDDTFVRMYFTMAKSQIDANNRKFENGCKGGQYGIKGGAPVGNRNAAKTTPKQPQNNPKTTPNVNDNDNDNDNDNVNEEKKDKSFSSTTIEAAERIDFDFLVSFFNDTTRGCFGNAVLPLPENQQKDLSNTISKYGVDKYREAVEKAAESDYLRGMGANGWQMSFSWFVKADNFAKVLAGNYDNRDRRISGEVCTNFNDWKQ